MSGRLLSFCIFNLSHLRDSLCAVEVKEKDGQQGAYPHRVGFHSTYFHSQEEGISQSEARKDDYDCGDIGLPHI